MIPTWGTQTGVNAIFNSADFSLADITHSAIAYKGALTPNFTRATEKRIPGHEGILCTLVAGELGFPGARRVRNHVSTTSENFSNAAWIKYHNATVGAAQTDPNGGASAYLVYPSASSVDTGLYNSNTTLGAGRTGLSSWYLKPSGFTWAVVFDPTGTKRVWFNLSTGVVGTQTGGATGYIESAGNGFYRCTVKGDSAATSYSEFAMVDADNSTTTTASGQNGLIVWHPLLEDITGRTDQTTPSEYVSVGVASSPAYHGSMVDGVKCFPTSLTGAALPTRATYEAVSLPGVAGSYVSTPDSAANSITGDIDIRVKVNKADYSVAGSQCLCSKLASAGTQLSYAFILSPGKFLDFLGSFDGTTFGVTSSSTVAATPTNGADIWFRVTRTSAGVSTFYQSTDGSAWTQIGATVSDAGGALFNSTAAVEVGSIYTGTAYNFSSTIYRAQIYNGIDGTLAVDFDASRYEGGTTLTGSTGETWTLNGNAVIHKTNNPMTTPLIELAATNLLTAPEDFSNASWSKANCNFATTNIVAPDGTATADQYDASGATSYAQQQVTSAAGAHTASIYAKPGVGAVWRLAIYDSAYHAAWFSASTFTLLSADSGVTARIEPSANGFYRISVTYTTTAINPYHEFSVVDASGGTTLASPTTNEAAIWGAKIETGTAATSYHSGTRNADQLYYTGADVANIKTLAAIDFKREVGFSASNYVASVSDGTINNGVDFLLNSATAFFFQGWSGAVNQWNTGASNAYTPGTLSSAAVSFATNDIKMSKDGVAQTADTSATAPAFTRLEYGTFGGVFQMNGYPGKIYGWLSNKSQSELNAVTR